VPYWHLPVHIGLKIGPEIGVCDCQGDVFAGHEPDNLPPDFGCADLNTTGRVSLGSISFTKSCSRFHLFFNSKRVKQDHSFAPFVGS
jgi:hypothetical protein